MTVETELQDGRLGRLCVLRLRPNQDLTEALEAACAETGIERAVVRAAIGSLNDAHFEAGEKHLVVAGPGLEILTLTGEVRPDAEGRPRASLSGSVCDSEGRVKGGRFLPGQNAICITVEMVLQEWIAETG